jgi:hypothetical protein
MSGTCACRRGINFASVLVTGPDHGVEMSSDPPNAKEQFELQRRGTAF